MRNLLIVLLIVTTAGVVLLLGGLKPHGGQKRPSASAVEADSKLWTQEGRAEGLGWFSLLLPQLMNDPDAPIVRGRLLHVRSAPVSFPSGRVVAADVMMLPNAAAFARKVPPGAHAIDALVETYDAEGREWDNVLMVGIRFSEAPIASWTDAAFPAGTFTSPDSGGHPVDALLRLVGVIPKIPHVPIRRTRDGELGCFSVDAARAGYFDEALYRAVEGAAGGSFYERLSQTMQQAWKARKVITLINHPAGGGAAFSSGDSDGCFSSYFGLDANGGVAALVTDFTYGLRLPGTAG